MSQLNTLSTIADNIVSSWNTGSNFGGVDHIYVGRASDGTYTELYFNFDISPIPAFARVANAALRLSQYNDANDFQSPTIEVAAALVGGTWSEGGIVFNNRPGNASGSPVAVHNVHNENTWHTWDVTALMQKVFDGSIAWNGIHLYYTGSASSTMKYFHSKEYGSLVPQLAITWDYPFPKLQVGGGWHQISEVWINVGGVWRRVTEFSINVDGVWKSFG